MKEKKQEIEKKNLSRKSITQIGIIVGQMTHCQPATFSGIKVRFVDSKVFDTWVKSLKDILDEEI